MSDTKPSDVEGLAGKMWRRLAFLRLWFQPDSGDETVNFADRDGPWTILDFLDDADTAATTLAAQQAELDRIRATFDAPGGNLFDYVAKLEAENQRLRAALKEPS